MKNKLVTLLSFTALAAVAIGVIAAHSPRSPHPTVVKRGEYLVAYSGCGDCHTPRKMGSKGPEPDLTRLLSGHPHDAQLPPPPKLEGSPWFSGCFTAWAGPWGISYAPNLTPDRDTGLGIWTREMFIKAVRTGKHYGVGRDILPPMPWQSINVLTDDDLTAVYEYLRSIPPVRNSVPDPVPAGGRKFFE